jgi:predicted O-methyltransferase YrrM
MFALGLSRVMERTDLGQWLRTLKDPARTERVWRLGLLTGLRAEPDGRFSTPNFERGLVLDRLVELRKPRAILELGTGRGLGAFAMAAAGRAHGVALEITTVDARPLTSPQEYALEVDGVRQVRRASCDEVWSVHLDPELRRRVTPLLGLTTRILPRLVRSGRRFDLIFIDAGHDIFHVVHDLAYATALLGPGGAILMDDFAPLEEFGLGTCIAFTHARRLFDHVELFATEGLVYGGAVHPEAPRGMVFLADPRGPAGVRRGSLLFWRAARLFLEQCYRPAAFPARLQR